MSALSKVLHDLAEAKNEVGRLRAENAELRALNASTKGLLSTAEYERDVNEQRAAGAEEAAYDMTLELDWLRAFHRHAHTLADVPVKAWLEEWAGKNPRP